MPCALRPRCRARSGGARALSPAGLLGDGCFGLRDLDAKVGDAAELGDRGVRVVERLAVVAVLVLHRRDALPLHRARDENRGLSRRRDGPTERGVDRVEVVAVERDRIPPERLGARDVRVEVPSDHRLATLAEPVDVDDRREVVELEVRSVLERLPHRALGHLAVAAQHPHAARQALEVLRGERHPDADRKALAERARRDVDPRDGRCRMALEHAPERPVLEDLLVGDDARCAEDRVEKGRRVALREDEPVVRGALRVVEVEAEVAVDEDGREVGCGHRGRRMPRLRGSAHAHGVDAELLRELSPSAQPRSRGHSTAVLDAVTLKCGAQQIARAVRARRQRLGRLAVARDARDG